MLHGFTVFHSFSTRPVSSNQAVVFFFVTPVDACNVEEHEPQVLYIMENEENMLWTPRQRNATDKKQKLKQKGN